MDPERDYEVFRLAVRKALPVVAMSIWPILIALLPLIWQIVQILLANRAERFGVVSAFESARAEASRAEQRAIRAVAQAEREVPAR